MKKPIEYINLTLKDVIKEGDEWYVVINRQFKKIPYGYGKTVSDYLSSWSDSSRNKLLYLTRWRFRRPQNKRRKNIG